jgi:hypothetical protein
MSAMGGFVVALLACAVIAAVLIPWLLRQHGAEDLATVAARHGLHHSRLDPFGCTRVAFPLFRKGDGQLAENVVWRERSDGMASRAFDFSYFVETRDNLGNVQRHHTRFTCAMVQVDGSWPDVSITREGLLEKALDLMGLGDIQLESDEFNRQFALRSPDRRFAITLIDARMIDFLLTTEARFAFFVKGRWLLVASDPVGPALVPALLHLAETFVEHIPRVVYELWPSPFRDEDGKPLGAGDEGYGDALALAELSEANPWDVLRQGLYGSLEGDDEAPEYDLDGNLVEELPEDPWGQQPRPLPE